MVFGILIHLAWTSLPAEEKEATWLKVTDGFKVTHFADDELATDIYCMTTDRLGRIVVAGPGYIKILLDKDGDGKADAAKLFSDQPKNGAMGLCFDGTDLLCVGDAGLLRFTDRNKDDQADGPPQVLIRFKTGGEHDSHAIRKGPDGWWYLISGNYSGVGAGMIASNRSPVKNPFAGVITRISPDFRERQIFADGMRNTYDFDFDEQGDLFIYDSDGERDVSMPWYQPTKVYRLHPGSNTGWVSRNWKRPDYFFDMPTVAARLGRGSPTGVVCYRHWQFPKPYRNAMFVLDWTFGRVIAVRKTANKDKGQTFENELFVSGKGTHGFAPTDTCVGVDGSLYISVGGRATRGSVYRIRHIQSAEAVTPIQPPASLADCLDLPQPQSAWSRALSDGYLAKADKEELEEALFNESFSLRHRSRVVELLTSHFQGISRSKLEKIKEINSPEIQQKLAWSVCQQRISQIDSAALFHFLNSETASVRIAALEALTGNQSIPSYLAQPIWNCLASNNLHLQKAAASFIHSSRFNPIEYLKPTDLPARENSPVAYWLGRQMLSNSYSPEALAYSLIVMDKSTSNQKQLVALRLFQLALGDVGPFQGLPQIYESYRAKHRFPGNLQAKAATTLRKLLKSDNDQVVTETIRCLAMAQLAKGDVALDLVNQIDKDSHPVADIHALAAIAHSENRSPEIRQKIAEAILNIQPKIDELELNQDRNWEPRFKEIVRKLVQLDNKLELAIADQGITREGQIFLFQFIPADKKVETIDRFVESLQQSEDFVYSSDVVRLLATTSSSKHWEWIRKSFKQPNVRDAVVELLARRPYEGDRPKFVVGLESSQVKTIRTAAQALLKLTPTKDAVEQFALLNAMQRISQDKEGYAAREWIVRTLQRNMGQSFGFLYGSNGYAPQAAVAGKWRDYLYKEFPEAAAKQKAKSKLDVAEFSKRLLSIDWNSGNRERGIKLYATLSCGKCHGNRNRLGPDLAGVTKRFSREDLFRAIVDPSFQVPSRYQTTMFETEDGKIYSGIIIYDSVDGVLIRDSDNKTVRIEKAEIIQRKKVSKSLMPENLLDELDNQGYADLYEYLKSL